MAVTPGSSGPGCTRGVYTTTSMPNARALGISVLAIAPWPITPRVFPRTRRREWAFLGFHSPALVSSTNGTIRRAQASSNASAWSETSSRQKSGTLQIRMPSAVAWSTAMLSIPVPNFEISVQRSRVIQRARRKGLPTGENGICLGDQLCQLGLIAALGNNEMHAERLQHAPLDLQIGPGIVGDQYDRRSVDVSHRS